MFVPRDAGHDLWEGGKEGERLADCPGTAEAFFLGGKEQIMRFIGRSWRMTCLLAVAALGLAVPLGASANDCNNEGSGDVWVGNEASAGAGVDTGTNSNFGVVVVCLGAQTELIEVGGGANPVAPTVNENEVRITTVPWVCYSESILNSGFSPPCFRATGGEDGIQVLRSGTDVTVNWIHGGLTFCLVNTDDPGIVCFP